MTVLYQYISSGVPVGHSSIGSCCALRYKIYTMKNNRSPQHQNFSEKINTKILFSAIVIWMIKF